MKRALVLTSLLAAGCADLQGLGGPPEPLATIQLNVTGDIAAVRDLPEEQLRVALVWGKQWFPDFTCLLPQGDVTPELAAVRAIGCRDTLAFTPDRVASSVAITSSQVAELPLLQLPSADVMVGDLTGRVGFGSLVVFDDRNGDGTLSLTRFRPLPDGDFGDPGGGNDMGPEDPEELPASSDRVYGASFVSMSAPDRRLAFREGQFYETGFFPRKGCGAPLPGFSIVSAGGFSFEAAVAATLAGELPPQDPASCAQDSLDATVVEIPLRTSGEVREAACAQRRVSGTVRYRDPPSSSPLEGRAWACTGIPQLGESNPRLATISQLVVASSPEERCKGLTHYTLVGCDESDELDCDNYEYDLRMNAPDWWPCPLELAP